MAKLKTGRHTSGLKADRQNKKRREANAPERARIRALARAVEQAVADKDAARARTLLSEAFSAWDRAAKKHLIHTRNADRKKGRLAARVSSLTPTAQPA